jgi:hypothetical protein
MSTFCSTANNPSILNFVVLCASTASSILALFGLLVVQLERLCGMKHRDSTNHKSNTSTPDTSKTEIELSELKLTCDAPSADKLGADQHDMMNSSIFPVTPDQHQFSNSADLQQLSQSMDRKLELLNLKFQTELSSIRAAMGNVYRVDMSA